MYTSVYCNVTRDSMPLDTDTGRNSQASHNIITKGASPQHNFLNDADTVIPPVKLAKLTNAPITLTWPIKILPEH